MEEVNVMLYHVEITVTSTACIDVEAASEEEAIEEATVSTDLIWEGGEWEYEVSEAED